MDRTSSTQHHDSNGRPLRLALLLIVLGIVVAYDLSLMATFLVSDVQSATQHSLPPVPVSPIRPGEAIKGSSSVAIKPISYELDSTSVRAEVPSSVQGVQLTKNTCFPHRGDRLIIKGDTTSTNYLCGQVRSRRNVHAAFLASDLCAMGHTTKDATHLLSWFLDFASECGGQQLPWKLTILYGNTCMQKRASSNRKARVFHNVLLQWFQAAISALRTVAAEKKLPLTIDELFFEDAVERKFCADVSIKRFERWRWFRTREHANHFRLSLYNHFNLSVPLEKTVNDSVVVTILRRDEDRHFNEVEVFRDWKERCIGNASHQKNNPKVHFQLAAFDNIRGRKGGKPPTYREQLKLLMGSDILFAAHGAGLASFIALQQSSVAVEFFPNNFRYNMYEELAVLADLYYVPYESPIVWPPRCCSGRGLGALPVIKAPSEVNGIGARACKKCDCYVTQPLMDGILRDAVNTVLRARSRLGNAPLAFWD